MRQSGGDPRWAIAVHMKSPQITTARVQVRMKCKREGNHHKERLWRTRGSPSSERTGGDGWEVFSYFSSILLLYSCLPHNHSSAVKKGNNTFICQAPAPRPVVLNLFFTFCSLSIILNTWCVIWYLHSMSTLLLISLTHTSLKRTWHKYNWKWKINYRILNNFCISDLKLNQ